MKPQPTNKTLYEKVKKEVYKMYPKHSAYRSGLIVKKYKEQGGTYSGDKESGKLGHWFKQKWTNQRGETGYKKKGDVYRPTRKYKETPKTFKELGGKNSKRVKTAMKEKGRTGRVKKF